MRTVGEGVAGRDEQRTVDSPATSSAAPVVLEWWALPKWFLIALGGVVVASILRSGEGSWGETAAMAGAIYVVALADARVRLTLDHDELIVRSLFRGPKRLSRGDIAGYFVERAGTWGQAERVVVVGASGSAGRPALTIELGGSTPRRAERRLIEVTTALCECGVQPLAGPADE